MLARARRVPTLAAAMALGLATAAGAAAATAPKAAGAPVPAAPSLSLAGPQSTVLPNGDRVLVTGSGPAASVIVQAPGGTAVPAVRYAPDSHHAYVIPESVLAHPAQPAAAPGYQIPALSTAGAPAVTPYYPLSILQINALGLDGKPADATIFLTDVDDVTKYAAAGHVGLPGSTDVQRPRAGLPGQDRRLAHLGARPAERTGRAEQVPGLLQRLRRRRHDRPGADPGHRQQPEQQRGALRPGDRPLHRLP